MSTRAARRSASPDLSLQSADFLGSRLRLFGIALTCAKLALIPVVFDHDSDVPFSVIKALLSHALAYVLFGVIVGLIVSYGRTVVVWSWLHVPVLAFFAANVLATLFAVDPLLALYGAHTRMGGLGTLADGVLLYFAIALLMRTGKETLALALSFLTGSVIVLGYELVQFVGKDPFTWAIDPATRPFSTIGQTTSLAEYLTVVAIGAGGIAAFGAAVPPLARVLLILYAALAVAGTIITETRSAFLGMAAGAALLLALTWTAHPDRRARVFSLIGAAGATAALTAVLLLTPLGARLLSTVETAAPAEGDSGLRLEGAADARLALYRIALEMVRDRPLLGHGPDNFLASLPRFRSDSEPAEVRDNPTSSAHSWVAQVAATSGTIGLIAFLAIAAGVLFLTFNSGFRPAAWVALGMLGAFLGTGLTTVNAIATDWLFWAAAGVIAGATSHPMPAGVSEDTGATDPSRARSRAKAAPPGQRRIRSLIAYTCVGLGILVAATTVNAFDASRSARTSQFARPMGQNQLAIAAGIRATRSDSLRPQYWDTLGLAYVSGDRLGDAVSAFERAGQLAPYDIRYDGDLARAYAALALKGDRTATTRAREVAERVVRTDPNNPRAHLTRAVVMQATGDLSEALKSVQRAFVLDPASGEASLWITATQVYLDSGRPSEAVRVARAGLTVFGQTSTSVALRYELARALVANGQHQDALAELDAALLIQPNNSFVLRLRAQIVAELQK